MILSVLLANKAKDEAHCWLHDHCDVKVSIHYLHLSCRISFELVVECFAFLWDILRLFEVEEPDQISKVYGVKSQEFVDDLILELVT